MESLIEEAGRRPCSPAQGAQDATATAPPRRDCTRGPLVSIDGVTGVGKTYLTARAAERLDTKPLLLDGFSDRKREQPGLAEALLAALRRASGKDPFLRGGTPMTETLLLLAIKRHDLDTVIPDLAGGRTVIEGRSVDSTAVCQALLLHPGDPDAALDEAVALLGLAASFRQLPDLTVLITDDASAAIDRAQRRDKRNYTLEQATFMCEACALFERVAAADPARYRVIDRRSADEHEATGQLRAWIGAATVGLACVREPWQDPGAPCIYCGRRLGQEPA
jgi:dTMP kinase